MNRIFFAALSTVALGCAEPGGDGADVGTDAGPIDVGTPGMLEASAASVVLPLIAPGAGGVSGAITLRNTGDTRLLVSGAALSGDAGFTLESSPAFVEAGGTAVVRVRFAGAASTTVATSELTLTYAGGTVTVSVLAVVGGSGLPVATYEDVFAVDGRPCGVATTVALPSAPFPNGGSPYTDASVRVFLPVSYRDAGDHDVVLHFHGHSTTLAATLASHRYEQHLCATGANLVLVVPQGPVNAASGDFGKLMTPTNTRSLLDDVLVMLFRDGRIARPLLGEVHLTAHSGGYLATAANLGALEVPVRHVALYDGLYGSVPTFQTYAAAGQRFRSNYTTAGGALALNQAFVTTLAGLGVDVSEDPFLADLLDTDSVVSFADTTHDNATRIDNLYGDTLRFASRRTVNGGRIELLSATATAGTATVTFVAPPEPNRTGFAIEASTDGVTWNWVGTAGNTARSATFALSGPRYVRMRAVVLGMATTQWSDTYAVDNDAKVLVVDAFDRVLGGSYAGLEHDFAARVGVPIRASTVSSRALVEGNVSLAGYDGVLWLAGDTSVDDRPISPDEQGLLAAYLSGGGKLVVSGSEVAYSLAGDSFLSLLGAAFGADDSNAVSAIGMGPLASVPNVPFVYAGAPYREEYPDVFATANGGVAILQYAVSSYAGVGRAGESAIIGFPIELVAEPNRTSLVRSLFGFTGLTLP